MPVATVCYFAIRHQISEYTTWNRFIHLGKLSRLNKYHTWLSFYLILYMLYIYRGFILTDVYTGLFKMIVGVLTTCHTQYTWDSSICIFFYLTEQHSKFLLHTLQVLYICTLCDSTNINTIIEFVPYVSGDGFSDGSDSYLQFRDKHAPCLLKLCVPPSSGIVRWWLFPEFDAELSLDNCTTTIILNNPVYFNRNS